MKNTITQDAITKKYERASLVYNGDESDIEKIRNIIENSYGAFGHKIGTITSPIDLHCALHKSKLSFNQVSGLKVKNYDPDIPKYAMT
jgi:hypothetical protein